MTRKNISLLTRNNRYLMTRNNVSLLTRNTRSLLTRNNRSLMARNNISLLTRNNASLLTRNNKSLMTRKIYLRSFDDTKYKPLSLSMASCGGVISSESRESVRLGGGGLAYIMHQLISSASSCENKIVDGGVIT